MYPYVWFPLMNIFKEGGVLSASEFLGEYKDPRKIPSQLRKRFNRYASTKCESPACKQPCLGGCPLMWKLFDPEKEIKGYSKD